MRSGFDYPVESCHQSTIWVSKEVGCGWGVSANLARLDSSKWVAGRWPCRKNVLSVDRRSCGAISGAGWFRVWHQHCSRRQVHRILIGIAEPRRGVVAQGSNHYGVPASPASSVDAVACQLIKAAQVTVWPDLPWVHSSSRPR